MDVLLHRVLVLLHRVAQQEGQRRRHVEEVADRQRGRHAVATPQQAREHHRTHDPSHVVEQLAHRRRRAATMGTVHVQQQHLQRRSGDVQQHAQREEQHRVADEGPGGGEALADGGREEEGEQRHGDQVPDRDHHGHERAVESVQDAANQPGNGISDCRADSEEDEQG